MGLFRKKTPDTPPPAPTVDPAELASLQEEMAQLRERLDASERSKVALEERVDVSERSKAALEDRVEQLDERLADERMRRETEVHTTDAPPPPPASPAPPPPPASLDETPPIGMIRVDDLAARVDELAALFDADSPALHDAGSGADDTSGHLDTLREQLEAVTNRLDALDLRVTNVSTELANQLSELSSDIEQLAEREPAGDAPESATAELDTTELEARLAARLDGAIDEVHDSTERLAAEQARYQIQFRQDLAALAERLRRPGTG